MIGRRFVGSPNPLHSTPNRECRHAVGESIQSVCPSQRLLGSSEVLESLLGQGNVEYSGPTAIRSRRSLPARVPLFRESMFQIPCRMSSWESQPSQREMLDEYPPTGCTHGDMLAPLARRGAGGLRPMARTRFVRSVSQGQRPRISLRTPSLMQRMIQGRSCAWLQAITSCTTFPNTSVSLMSRPPKR